MPSILALLETAMFQRFRHKKGKQADTTSDTNPDGSRRADEDSPNKRLTSARIPDGTIAIRERKRSLKQHIDPRGINVLSQPPDGIAPTIDIIFVHGLGGTSRRTWSYNHDLQYFWPKEWLPTEPGLDRARILSFGYDANFASPASANFLSITDFATDLLLQMKFITDEAGQALNIGEVPIMFIVHSMGGLVVKKAFILGMNDPAYKSIMFSLCSIVFLGTPHRGSAFGDVLNMLLSCSPLQHSPKVYISELQRNSSTLNEINDQFRHFLPRLNVVSFFETIQTRIGPGKLAIVKKDSGVLGCPDEISAPLNADHHGMCKYSSRNDPSYISVRNVIISLVLRFQRKVIQKADTLTIASVEIPEPISLSLEATEAPESKADTSTIASVEIPEPISLSLGVTEAPEGDFNSFNDLKMPGSCKWITTDEGYSHWLDDKSLSPSFLWVNGPPGSGKSILATFVISQLRKVDRPCQFYYFRYGEREKESPAALLKSLIYQMAGSLPQYSAKLLKLVERAQQLSKAESRLLWQKAVIGILERLCLDEPFYWVLDALDECNSPHTVISLLSGLLNSTIPIRILITGRVQLLKQHFERLAKGVRIFEVSSSSEASRTDLRRFVEREMEFVDCEPDYKPHVTEVLLRKANGNFLWSRLVLSAVQDRSDEESIEAALQELPSKLGELYLRMESNLVGSYKDLVDKNFASCVLSWVALAQRQLSLQELGQALQPEFPTVNLSHRVSRLCGEFVSVDKNDNISMVHHTAREFLTTTNGLTLSIDSMQGHVRLFSKCMDILMDPGLKIRLGTSSDTGFAHYAAISWSHHLSRSCAHQDRKFLTLLVDFLHGQSVLTWIWMLAIEGKLRVLVSASKDLLLFAQRRSILDHAENLFSESFQAKDFLKSWAFDLVKLVAKFGTHLLLHPDSIFTLVPAFCPSETEIYKQFGNNGTISVSGFARSTWDDYLVKFSVGRDAQALGILCSDRHFATLTASHVTLWHADTCEEAYRITHGERVLHMKFSANGDMLVTCGFRTTKVWDLSTTQQLYTFQNPEDTLAMDVIFSANDTKIFIFSDDGVTRSVSLTQDTEWQRVTGSLGDGVLDSRYGSPKLVAFHPAGTQIAIAYRGVPVLVWNLAPLRFLGKCRRPGEKDSTQFWADINALDWNPITGHVIGAYNDGCLFKWHPMEPMSEEVTTTAALVCCSPEGNLMATSSTNGTIRVWNFHTFALLYQLSCSSQSAAISLSPDSRRIYDVRESTCNVLQPNTLVKFAEADEKGSDSSSASQWSVQPSEETLQLLEPITALGVAQDGSTFFTGDDEGILKLIDLQDGRSRELSNSWITLSHILCSEDGSRLVTADLYGRVIVSPLGEACLFQDFEAKTKPEQLVKQLLLSSDNTLLLIVSNHCADVWSIEEKRIIASTPLDSGVPYFINHPSEKSYILAFGVPEIRVLRWHDLTPQVEFKYATPVLLPEEDSISDEEDYRQRLWSSLGDAKSVPSVDQVFITENLSSYVVEISLDQRTGRGTKDYIQIKSPSLVLATSPSSPSPIPIPFTPLPTSLLTNIDRILGLLPFDVTESDRRSSAQRHRSIVTTSTTSESDLLAFIDNNYWVCTWPVSDTTGSQIKKHFFLPRDWINRDCLDLATVTRNGVLLCPKNGEVGIVDGGFKTIWVG